MYLYNTHKINFGHLLAENLENIFKSKEGIIPWWSVLTLKCWVVNKIMKSGVHSPLCAKAGEETLVMPKTCWSNWSERTIKFLIFTNYRYHWSYTQAELYFIAIWGCTRVNILSEQFPCCFSTNMNIFVAAIIFNAIPMVHQNIAYIIDMNVRHGGNQ